MYTTYYTVTTNQRTETFNNVNDMYGYKYEKTNDNG